MTNSTEKNSFHFFLKKYGKHTKLKKNFGGTLPVFEAPCGSYNIFITT
jgi:hypothetical protein